MLLNFCHPLLQTSTILSENTVPADGYECSNLLSDDPVRRAQGFRAERFIKPPVDILLLFNVPLDVICILAESSSSECGLEVWVPSRDPAEGQCKYDRKLSLGRISTPQRTVARFRNETLWHRAANNVCLGSWLAARSAESFRDISLQHSHSLINVRAVAVRIYYVQGPSSPGLQSLEVWAFPGRACSRIVQSALLQVAAKLGQVRTEEQAGRLERLDFGSSDRSAERKKSVLSKGQSLHGSKRPSELKTPCQGPDEFYDEITFELMTRPMLLPSGHNVDVSTLDKLAATDRQWGREPADPFTGVRLSTTYQAKPNTGLKARIDNFLLRHHQPIHQKLSCYTGENIMSRRMASDSAVGMPPTKVAKLNESNLLCTEDTRRGHEEIVTASLDAALQSLFGTPEPKEKDGVQRNLMQSAVLQQELQQTSESQSSCSPEKANVAISFEDHPSSKRECAFCKSAGFVIMPCQHVCCRTCVEHCRRTEDGSGRRLHCSSCDKSFTYSQVQRLWL